MRADRVSIAEFEPGRRPGVTRVVASVDAAPTVDLPLIAIVGDRPGPVLIAAAGVHGDEYEGPRALWQIADELAPSALAGSFVALPICNPWAFAAGARATPERIDGINLARTFPGDPAGSPTPRLAAALLLFVTRLQPALFVDLHSGEACTDFCPWWATGGAWATFRGRGPPRERSGLRRSGKGATIRGRSTRKPRDAVSAQ